MSGIAQGADLAVAGALLWDGTGAEPSPNRYVEIRRGRITRVAPMEQVSLPGDLPVLDAEGRFVMPGLIDCHTHLMYCGFQNFGEFSAWPIEYHTLRALESAAALLSYGYTTIRDVGARGSLAIAVRDAVRQGLVPGPRVVASSQILSATCGLGDNDPPWIEDARGLGLVVNGVDAVRKAVRTQIKMGVDNVKVGITGAESSPYVDTEQTAFSLEELRALTDEAHRFGRTVACHAESYLGARMAVEAGVTTLEHGTRMDDETIGLLAEAPDIYLVPTLCTVYFWLERPNPLAKARMEVNAPLWLDSLGRAHAAGVKIVAGSDIGNWYRHGEQAIELGLLVKHGFSAEEALAAATRTAAQALHLADQVGTLEVGKLGDLLVLNGDPQADVGILRKREAFHRIVQGGEAMLPGDIAPEVRR